MSAAAVATNVLQLIAGVGIFLIACNMMSGNLEAVSSNKLKALFGKACRNKLLGVGVGTAATAVIQSSGATSVMVIGFVNAGIMTLTQAATVIFGANIGTTVTGQMVALGLFGGSVSTSVIFASLAGVGAFISAFSKRDKLTKAGGIIAGFGALFVGLNMMSGSMSGFAALTPVKTFLAAFKNPLLLVLIGAVLTAVVQSSSVMTSLAITMTVTGLITLNQGVYLTMGSNIGSCVTALIAGLTSTVNAKRTALIHLIFNMSGAILFTAAGFVMRIFGIDYGFILNKIFPHAPQIQLAMFHTFFNVITVAAALPLTGALVKLVTKIIPNKAERDGGEPRLRFIEEHILANPPVAVMQIKREISGMAQTAIQNFDLSIAAVCNLDFEGIQTFKANENLLNFLNKEITRIAVKLLRAELSERDRVYLTTAIRSASDLERVGDYAENNVEYAYKLQEYGQTFSPEAIAEIDRLKQLVHALYSEAAAAYDNCDEAALRRAYTVEDEVDDYTDMMQNNHLLRLSSGACTPEAGAQYISLATGVERIADHFINVAKTIELY